MRTVISHGDAAHRQKGTLPAPAFFATLAAAQYTVANMARGADRLEVPVPSLFTTSSGVWEILVTQRGHWRLRSGPVRDRATHTTDADDVICRA